MKESIGHLTGASQEQPAPRQVELGDSGRMTKKTAADLMVAERIRAHLRQQMYERKVDQTKLGNSIGIDDGAMSKIMTSARGIGLTVAMRLSRGLEIPPTRLLQEDPPHRFFSPGSEDWTVKQN